MMDSQHPQTTAPSSQYRLKICPQRYFAEFLVIFRSFVGLHTVFIYTTKLLFLLCTSLLKINKEDINGTHQEGYVKCHEGWIMNVMQVFVDECNNTSCYWSLTTTRWVTWDDLVTSWDSIGNVIIQNIREHLQYVQYSVTGVSKFVLLWRDVCQLHLAMDHLINAFCCFK